MTFWSDDRSHVLEDAITYAWLIAVGLAIGAPSMQFPFLILCFRLLGSMSHANTRVGYGWLGEHIFVSPQFHRTHHALQAAGRRSCNFGTILSLWDISFGTARFRDNTVETGDAGAEPALVNGSWGEQQIAGFRRMVRLARRGKKTPADEDGMIPAVSQDWVGRVLDQGRLGIPVEDGWKLDAYEQYKASSAPRSIHVSSGKVARPAEKCSIRLLRRASRRAARWICDRHAAVCQPYRDSSA